ncbi:MAG: carboxypeptidase-like regulatory domain-containing protein [Bacteroidales bacterium]|nr:carboxypeptidase-like regulatory domain-containing protein [Bacteroidales bacterium]
MRGLRNILFIFAIAMLQPCMVVGQETGLLTGSVFDNFTKDAISLAKITVSQNGEIITDVFADFDGKYKIPLQEGVYIVHASQVGLVSKKIKIEIKSNETYTLNFLLSEARYDFATAYDTIKVNAFKVKEIDEKLKVAIDNHIKMAKRKFIFPNKKRNIIVVGIADRDYDYYDLEHIDINDVKLKHKQFKESQFGEGFNVYINFLRRNNIRSELCYKKLFYYKYNDWDIFLGTQIDELEFPFVNGLKNFEFQIKYKDIESNINGRYGWNHKKVQKYFYYDGRFPDKRHENYHTNYYIAEPEVESITIKRKSIFKDNKYSFPRKK